jgi:serine protease Do
MTSPIKPFLSLLLISVLVSGCVTPKSSIDKSPNVSLDSYKYALVSDIKYNKRNIDKYGIQEKTERFLNSEGLEIVLPSEANRFKEYQVARLLVVGISHQHQSDGAGGTYARMKMVFTDGYTGEQIVVISSRYQGLTVQGDLDGVTKKALNKFGALYDGYDSNKLPPAVKRMRKRKNDKGGWETVDISREEFESYLKSKSLHPVEGVWKSKEGDYKVGIKRDTNNIDRDFVSFILETDKKWWNYGEVKMKINKTASNSRYNIDYLMADHSVESITGTFTSDAKLEFKVPSNFTDEEFGVEFTKLYPSIGESSFTDSKPSDGSGQRQPSEKPATSNGSGFIVGKKGLVVTNYHVVKDAKTININLPGSKPKHSADVLLKDERNDVAVLKMTDFNYNDNFDGPIPYTVTSDVASAGQDAFTIGYPLGNLLGKSVKVTEGVISSRYGVQDDPRLYQISVPVQPGNSGGPLFDMNGNVIGVVVASLNAKFLYENANIIPQNVNFAVKSSYVSALLSMVEGKAITDIEGSNVEGGIDDKVRSYRKFIVRVSVQK